MGNKDVHAVCAFFSVFWAALVLNPRQQQTMRALMVRLGLVQKRGKLALTARGKRALAYSKQS